MTGQSRAGGFGSPRVIAERASPPSSGQFVPGLVHGRAERGLAAASVTPATSTGTSLATAPAQTTDTSHQTTDTSRPPGTSAGGTAASSPAGSIGSLLLGPKVAAGCRIAMGATMAFMLIIMI